MKPHLVLAILLVVAAALGACIGIPFDDGQAIQGSGTLAEEERPVAGVTAIQLSMPGTLYIEIGPAESLRISAEDNLLPYIETDARAGELDIHTTPNIDFRSTQPIDFYLTVQSLDTIRVTSSGSVEAPDLIATHFEAGITSSGSIAIQSLQAETLDVEISSSGNLAILGGSVGRQTVHLSSSGGYDAKDLQSQEANLRLTSSGSATVHVLKLLEANLSSSGSVYYAGSPQLNVDTSSSGRAVSTGG